MSDGPVGRLFGFSNKCPDCGQEIGDHIYCGEGAKLGCPKPDAAKTEIESLRLQLANARANTLKMVAGLFSESIHEAYTREEIVSIVEDMIRLGSERS